MLYFTAGHHKVWAVIVDDIVLLTIFSGKTDITDALPEEYLDTLASHAFSLAAA